MSITNIEAKVAELKELESFIAEINEEAEAIRDAIKQEMMNRNVEELEAGQYIIRWTNVTTNRFDSANFKKNLPELYKEYLKQSISKRFSISA